MPFENQLTLEIRAFFFNAKRDYLPYYKNFSLEVTKDNTVEQILVMIKEQNRNFSYPLENLILRINGWVVTGDDKIGTVVAKEGRELQIDPALIYRSNNGLILNDDDFMKSYELLSPYASKDDLSYYKTLYPLHYASESFNFNREYIGDAILVLASKMIEDGSEYKKEILNAINNEFDGLVCCEYDNSLFHEENHSEAIANLKAMIGSANRPSFMEKISSMTIKKRESKRVESLEGRTVALYVGDNSSSELFKQSAMDIKSSGAEFIEFDRSTKLAGQTLIKTYPAMAYQKLGVMLLDALDSGADILVCVKDEDLSIFQNAIGESQRAVGRDIELTLISLSQFKELTEGVTV